MSVQPFELQQSIQRFTGGFLDGLSEAADAVRNSAPQYEKALLRRLVAYFSSALDIASGPHPVVNVLDMLVFVTLSRQALEQHWTAHLGPEGQEFVAAFAASEKRLWDLADGVISPEQHAEVESLITSWRSAHPDQIRVEWVRFSDFTEHANLAAQERAASARGLLGSFKSASATADQALMLAERGVFLANRFPWLFRLQVRLAVQETMDDSLHRLREVPSLHRIPLRALGYLVLLGLAWSVVFWGGYWLVK